MSVSRNILLLPTLLLLSPVMGQQAMPSTPLPAPAVPAPVTTQENNAVVGEKPAPRELKINWINLEDFITYTPENKKRALTKIQPEVTVAYENQGKAKAEDVLFVLNETAYLEEISQSERAWQQSKLAQEKAMFDLAQSRLHGQRNIDKSRINAERAAEDLLDYKTIIQPKALKEVNNNVEKAERAVFYDEENLNQLMKMYKEDQITEESEEIILTRSRNELMESKASLEMLKINVDLMKKRRFPREMLDKERAAEDAKLALATITQNVEFELRGKELTLSELEEKMESAQTKFNNNKENLEYLKSSLPKTKKEAIVFAPESKKLTPDSSVKTFYMTLLSLDKTLKANVAEGEVVPAVGDEVLVSLYRSKDYSKVVKAKVVRVDNRQVELEILL